MITATELLDLRTSGDDYELTEQLKARFARLRNERRPMYLTGSEFDEVLRWKLRGQYWRLKKRLEGNTDEIIRGVTGLALDISHPDPEYEIELRVGVLCVLRGVGVPVASAVLALVYPEAYAVIDFRGWRQVFGKERTTFSIADYKAYLREIRRLALELRWLAQEVDLAIWEYDRTRGWNAR